MNLLRGLIVLALSLSATEALVAFSGDPVAIRRSNGCFVIESMWNLSIQIVTDTKQVRSTTLQGVDLLRYHNAMSSLPFRFRQISGRDADFDMTLDRPPNTEKAVWVATSELKNPSANAIRVRAAETVIVIDVDGVRITFVDNVAVDFNDTVRQLTDATDVLIVGPAPLFSEQDRIEPKGESLISSRCVVYHAQSPEEADGHTIAVRAGFQHDRQRRTFRLHDRPLTLPAELEKLMTAKEAACTASQKVFAKLSTKQMNFRPSNGSHTPRWNAEHMMGRELLFFSQIFHAQDPAIPVIDLNPKQMPPDYEARHPDWTGEEEARQMQRVSAFTSRFAYLLKNLPLDEKAAGSNWTLRGLLRQMDRHYSEHTANVEKKFDLPDWPQE